MMAQWVILPMNTLLIAKSNDVCALCIFPRAVEACVNHFLNEERMIRLVSMW